MRLIYYCRECNIVKTEEEGQNIRCPNCDKALMPLKIDGNKYDVYPALGLIFPTLKSQEASFSA